MMSITRTFVVASTSFSTSMASRWTVELSLVRIVRCSTLQSSMSNKCTLERTSVLVQTWSRSALRALRQLPTSPSVRSAERRLERASMQMPNRR